MTSLFDKLNLRPQERRLVVIVLMVIFVLLNMWFVWPYFGDWGRVEGEIQRHRATLDRYQREINNRPKYETLQRKLEETGSEMLSGETDLQRIVHSQAAATGVQLGGSTFQRQGIKTNQFFQEGGLSISFTAGGKEIVDFLVGIAAQNAMIRVRDMNLRHADASQTRLGGTMFFIGNFQARSPTNLPARSVAAAAPQTKK